MGERVCETECVCVREREREKERERLYKDFVMQETFLEQGSRKKEF